MNKTIAALLSALLATFAVAGARAEPKVPATGPDARVVIAVASISVGAVAYGTVLAGGIVVTGIQHDPRFQAYVAQTPSSTSGCSAARAGVERPSSGASAKDVAALCDRADTFVIVQVVAMLVGTATMATGIVLYATRHSPQKPAQPALALAPRVGAGRGGMELTLAF